MSRTEKPARSSRWACSLLLVALAFATGPSRVRAATADEVDALSAQPCPAYAAKSQRATYPPEVVADARAGWFVVMRGLPRTRLVPPVDWKQNPFGDRSWTHYLHTLYWLDPLLYDYSRNGNIESLAVARDLVVDWVARNSRGAPSTAADAWDDKSAGDRAGYLGYVTRAAACEGLLTEEQAGRLIDSIHVHLDVLLHPDMHPPNNHALFVDLGLAYLARYAMFLPAGAEAFSRVRGLFDRDLRCCLEANEGVWLEHSATYQFLVVRLISKFVEIAGPGRYAERLPAIRDAAGWMVTPARRQVAFGDSNSETRIPAWAVAAGANDDGLKLFRRSGLAVVKKGDAHLLVTAGFHSPVHKHADDLGFHLYDDGRDVVSDTGVFHYNFDKWREFSRAPEAHSVLTVDGKGFPVDRHAAAYGSGIRAGGGGAGWYAIEGRNPLLRRHGVRHRRVFLYRPGRALLILDIVRSRQRHTYRRHFQIASGIATTARRGALRLRSRGFRAVLRETGRRSKRRVVAGRYLRPGGWEFPRRQHRVARPTVTYSKRDNDANFLASVELGRRVRGKIVSVGRRNLRVRVAGRGVPDGVLRVRRAGRRLIVSRSAG